MAELRACLCFGLLFLSLGTCIEMCFSAWWCSFTVMKHNVLIFSVEAQIVFFFFFYCIALHVVVCFLLAYSNQSWGSRSFYIGSTESWWHWVTISWQCILKLWLFLYHTPCTNLDNHWFTSASRVPAAFTKIHIVTLCVCFCWCAWKYDCRHCWWLSCLCFMFCFCCRLIFALKLLTCCGWTYCLGCCLAHI